jgi:hypothetical protein
VPLKRPKVGGLPTWRSGESSGHTRLVLFAATVRAATSAFMPLSLFTKLRIVPTRISSSAMGAENRNSNPMTIAGKKESMPKVRLVDRGFRTVNVVAEVTRWSGSRQCDPRAPCSTHFTHSCEPCLRRGGRHPRGRVDMSVQFGSTPRRRLEIPAGDRAVRRQRSSGRRRVGWINAASNCGLVGFDTNIALLRQDRRDRYRCRSDRAPLARRAVGVAHR